MSDSLTVSPAPFSFKSRVLYLIVNGGQKAEAVDFIDGFATLIISTAIWSFVGLQQPVSWLPRPFAAQRVIL